MEDVLKKIGLWIVIIAAGVSALAGSPLLAQSGGTLKDITYQKDGQKLVVTVAVDGQFSHETSFLTSPIRLILDLTPVTSITAAPYFQIGDAGVLDIRTGQFKEQTARVVFDLESQATAYTIGVVAGGLKLTFWLEAAEEPAPTPQREIPKEDVRRAPEQTPAVPYKGRDGFFIRAGGGVELFFSPNFQTVSEFPMYGETASLEDNYKWKTGRVLAAALGKYLHFGNLPMKAGIEASFWELHNEGTFVLSLPHPFIPASNRSVSFNEPDGLVSSMSSFSIFGLFSFLETKNFSVWFGPLIGITLGKIMQLEDYELNEKAPYTATDVTVGLKTFGEESISEFHFGGLLSLEYTMGRVFSLVLDTKILYLNPKSLAFNKRINFLQIQPVLGVQFNF